MGPGGPVGLNMLAIDQAMNDYFVDQEERIDFSITVRRIANLIISLQAEEAAEKAKQK